MFSHKHTKLVLSLYISIFYIKQITARGKLIFHYDRESGENYNKTWQRAGYKLLHLH